MKLKFRATPRDWAIFSVFCVFLLYLVAIAVLNLGSVANIGEFHGLNPFLAFSKEFLGPTIVGYLVALAFIIFSVSSYFFDREKGLGVKSSEKEEKGYSRWANVKEVKKELCQVGTKSENSTYGGMPIINDGENLWVDDSEYHSLIIGSTGSGKTQTMVLPLVESLAKHGESMIITDPKGEIYEKTATMLQNRGYNVILLNFREPQKGNSWNPLNLPYTLYKSDNKDKANELLDDLAMNILYDEKSQNQDPFWEKTSGDYFAGLALGLFEDAKEEEINLNSINLMTTVGEEKLGNTTYIKDYYAGKDPAGSANINVSSTIMAPSDTKNSILSVFKQKIKLFSSRENLSEMLSQNDFDIKDIGRKKTAVFIVIQDEKKTYHSLVTIFIKQCYETLIDVAQESGGKLKYRTNFILDEFANMPPLKDVTTMVTAARSRNIRFNFIIQNFSQLNQVYGKENADTIKGNCGNIIYLISTEMAALEEISKMCGDVKSKEKEKTSSTPLITVSDLQRLKEGEIIVLRTRRYPFKTKVVYDWKIDWGYKRETAVYPTREKRAVELFDLKAFVDKKREGKISEMMSSFNSPREFMPPLGIPTMPNEPSMPNDRHSMPSDIRPISNNDSFNIDELMKKIDAKIAEIEEQENNDSSVIANSMSNDNTNVVVKENIIIERPVDNNKNNANEVVNNVVNKVDIITPKTSFSVDNKIPEPINKVVNGITDDQFFDDFFNDDEY